MAGGPVEDHEGLGAHGRIAAIIVTFLLLRILLVARVDRRSVERARSVGSFEIRRTPSDGLSPPLVRESVDEHQDRPRLERIGRE